MAIHSHSTIRTTSNWEQREFFTLTVVRTRVACFACHSLRSCLTFDAVGGTSDACGSSSTHQPNDRSINENRRTRNQKKIPKKDTRMPTLYRKALEGRGGESLDKVPQIRSDSELLSVEVGAGTAEGANNLRSDHVGDGSKLVCLLQRRKFKLVCCLGGFQGKILGLLRGLGDQIRDPGGIGECLGLLRRFLGKCLSSLPPILHYLLARPNLSPKSTLLSKLRTRNLLCDVVSVETN